MRRSTREDAITRAPNMAHIGSAYLCYGILIGINAPSLLAGHTGNIVLLPGIIAMLEITTGCLIHYRLWHTSDVVPASGAAERTNTQTRRAGLIAERWAVFALAVLTGIVGLALWAVLHESMGIPYLILAGMAVVLGISLSDRTVTS